MKTNYPLKSNKKEKSYKLFIIIIIFAFLSVFSYFFSSFSRRVFYFISRPVLITKEKILKSSGAVGSYFIFKNALINKNKELEEEVGRLKLKEISYDTLLKENDELRSELGRENVGSKKVANILSKPPVSPYDSMVLDLGSNNGVSLGQKVYISENIIVGVIINVTSKTSLVELFSSGNRKQEATLLRTGSTFVLEGNGGGNLRLEVPKDTDLIWGDVFTYPGTPFSLGSVYYVDSNSQSSFKTAYIKTPGNIFASKYLFIE